MKIAASSASFARAIAAGDLTQLEWLDLCAAELEADGVVFDLAQFPRSDAEYHAQLKKLAVDLGLSVAAVAAQNALSGAADAVLGVAEALGAPVVLAPAPFGEGAAAWETLVAAAGAAASEGKRRNITLAVRQAAGTLCPDGPALKRLVKEADSAWLRFAPDPGQAGVDAWEAVLVKAPIAVHPIADLERFAGEHDDEAATLVHELRRFRGFVVLERNDGGGEPGALHAAFDRFRALRSRALLVR